MAATAPWVASAPTAQALAGEDARAVGMRVLAAREPYAVLGLPRGTNYEDVRAEYRKVTCSKKQKKET
eukprot:361698-Chlamydomonas_euryale.AAC.4